MKKILMGTSALALAGIMGAGEAKAATWDLDWGGYFEGSVAYRDGDGYDGTNNDGVDVIQDSEINFTPSITLDNGLTFGVNAQLETNSNVDNAVQDAGLAISVTEGDIIDESFMFVEGSFGTLRVGSTDAAGAAMQSNAPDVSWIGASSGSLTGLIPVGTDGPGTYAQPGGGDANKIVYFTPRFSGFQLGASYAHDGSEDKRRPNGRNSENLVSVGANYINSFGAFDIAVSGSYSTAEVNGRAAVAPVGGFQVDQFGNVRALGSTSALLPNNVVLVNPVAGAPAGGSSNPEHYAVSATLGYAGFSLGGSYANFDADVAGTSDVDFYDAGVAYRTGPWGASFQYSNTEGGFSETDQYLAAVDYKLGPGVRAGAYAGYAEQDFKAAGAGDIDGFIVGTGFRLDF